MKEEELQMGMQRRGDRGERARIVKGSRGQPSQQLVTQAPLSCSCACGAAQLCLRCCPAAACELCVVAPAAHLHSCLQGLGELDEALHHQVVELGQLQEVQSTRRISVLSGESSVSRQRLGDVLAKQGRREGDRDGSAKGNEKGERTLGASRGYNLVTRLSADRSSCLVAAGRARELRAARAKLRAESSAPDQP